LGRPHHSTTGFSQRLFSPSLAFMVVLVCCLFVVVCEGFRRGFVVVVLLIFCGGFLCSFCGDAAFLWQVCVHWFRECRMVLICPVCVLLVYSMCKAYLMVVQFGAAMVFDRLLLHNFRCGLVLSLSHIT
jgi:hypothetical protein